MAKSSSKKKAPSKVPSTRRSRRINLKGLAFLGGILAIIGALYFPIKLLADRKVRGSALAQAREIAEKGDADLALRHLDRYLATWPNDIPAMEERAKLLGESPRGEDQILNAANAYDLLLRLDPTGPGRRETRRKLAELYVLYSDAVRDVSKHRYTAAIQLARQLLENNETGPEARSKLARELEKDGAAHRLLAMALDGHVASSNTKEAEIQKQLEEAEKEYREALRIDPRDTVASERLADLYFTRLPLPAEAETTLDEMLEANPNSVPVRLSRYRAFVRGKQPDRARAELEAAVALAPKNPEIRLVATKEALGRQDAAEARRHLDAIPADHQDEMQAHFLRGQIDFLEQHSDQAIEEWRKGLAVTGGTDLDLTLSLASKLIELGRIGDARPLVAQFERLEEDKDKNDARGLRHYLRAMLEQKSGRPVQAIQDLELIKDRKETKFKPEIHLLLGLCYEQVGDEPRALNAYRRAAALAPQSSAPHRSIARLLQARDLDQAIGELERAMTQSPDDLPLLVDLIRLRLVRQLALPAARRQWRDVVEPLEHAEKLAPGNATLLGLRAEYLAGADRLSETVDLLGKAAMQGPGRKRSETWLSWATALSRVNRGDEALRALEQGSKPDAAGDHASLRLARAQILARSGQGQAARDLLEKDREAIPEAERPDLSRALGDLLRQLGDRDGSRVAYTEWARLAPDNPQPGLTLLALARINDDDEAARIGLETLRRLGADQEPYGLIAQAEELLRPDRTRPGPLSPARLDDADRLVAHLQAEAPQMSISHYLKGQILEQRAAGATGDDQTKQFEAAADAYRKAMKDESIAVTMPRLIEILTRLKRFGEIDEMKRNFVERADPGRRALIATEFDRISAAVALKLGDSKRAEFYANQVVDDRPDDVRSRIDLAMLRDKEGKPKEAEATLKALAERNPKDPTAWVVLVAYLGPRRPPAEAARLFEMVRDGYKGERPDLLMARCHWFGKDLAGARTLFKAVLAKQPDDLATLRAVAEFDEATGQAEELETILRTALKVDPKASWASRSLALRISSRLDPATWAEAWALVAPGSPGSGDSPEERLIRATLLARSPVNARRAEAIPAFIALASDLPASNPVGLDARLRMAQTMLDGSHPAEAWSFIAPVADDVNRPNPAALAIAIESLAKTGRPDQAGRRLDRLSALEPKSTRTAWARAWALKAKGKSAEASAAILSGFADAGATPEAEAIGVNGVDVLMQFADIDAAERLAKQVAARWPRDAWVLARVQFARKEYEPGLATCRAAIDAGSSREPLRYATAAAIARRSDPEFLKKVEQLGISARDKSPSDPNVLVFLATIYHLQDRYEEEVAIYRQAIALKSPSVLFLNNMAWTLSEGLHKPEEALSVVEELIGREGLSPEFLDTRGVIRSRLGLHDQAIADLELSAKGGPLAATYFHLARAYLKAGRAEDRRRCRDLAMKAGFDPSVLDPTDRADLKDVMGKL